MTLENYKGSSDFPMNRRDVLKTVGVAGAVSAFGFSGVAAASSHETYVLSQGGTNYTVTPVTYTDGGGNFVPIADFYNYASSANLGGSNTPIGIEDNNQSRMFLYRDDSGLHVVFLHDDYWSDGPTDVKDWQTYFEFSGLPTGGSWVIDEGNDPTDDFGDVDQFYWRWFPRWSDGGAYGLLSCEPGEEFSIGVTPDFNPNPEGSTFPEAPASEAWLAEDGWKFYNGDDNLITLDETASLTIACETCPECSEDLVAKYEFGCVETDPETGECVNWDFDLEGSGDEHVRYVPGSYESKEDEPNEPMSVTFDTDYCDLHVLVKSGRELEVQSFEDIAGSFTVDTANEEKYAISFVAIYCDVTDAQAAYDEWSSRGRGNGR